jgi:hypothetical protein
LELRATLLSFYRAQIATDAAFIKPGRVHHAKAARLCMGRAARNSKAKWFCFRNRASAQRSLEMSKHTSAQIDAGFAAFKKAHPALSVGDTFGDLKELDAIAEKLLGDFGIDCTALPSNGLDELNDKMTPGVVGRVTDADKALVMQGGDADFYRGYNAAQKARVNAKREGK